MMSKAISRICIGEIDQFSSRYNKNVSVKKYLKRIGAKTAALFLVSLYTGAEQAGCSRKLTNELGRIGYNIGMAFQIIDDILDFQGDQGVVGKPVGNDLKQGIYTLPLIYALEKNRTDLINLVNKEFYDEEDVKQIIVLTEKYDGINKAKKLALNYTEKAFKGIDNLPDNEAKEILKRVTESLLVRNY